MNKNILTLQNENGTTMIIRIKKTYTLFRAISCRTYLFSIYLKKTFFFLDKESGVQNSTLSLGRSMTQEYFSRHFLFVPIIFHMIFSK